MATLNVTFDFLTNAQSFVATQGTNVTCAWVNTGGNPAGALSSSLATKNNANRTSSWARTLTYQDMGVPAGATITGITAASLDSRCTAFTSGGATHQSGTATLVDGATTVTLSSARNFTATDATFVNTTGVDSTGLSLPASNSVVLTISNTLSTANVSGATMTLLQDNLNFTITYTPGATSVNVPGSSVTGSATAAIRQVGPAFTGVAASTSGGTFLNTEARQLPGAAATASAGALPHTVAVQIITSPVYLVDDDGNYLLDDNGNPIPSQDSPPGASMTATAGAVTTTSSTTPVTIVQLIGLPVYLLDDDGHLLLDDNGNPIVNEDYGPGVTASAQPFSSFPVITDVFVLGAASVASASSIGPLELVPLPGTAVTTATGDVALVELAPLAGVAAVASAAPLTAQISSDLVGASVTGAAGTLTSATLPALDGVVGTTSAQPLLEFQVSVVLNGAAATAGIGTFTIDTSSPVTVTFILAGTSATASAGVLSATSSASLLLTGAGATSTAGDLLITSPFVLPGASLTTAASQFGTTLSIPLLGSLIAASAGSIARPLEQVLTGVGAIASAGFIDQEPENFVGVPGTMAEASAQNFFPQHIDLEGAEVVAEAGSLIGGNIYVKSAICATSAGDISILMASDQIANPKLEIISLPHNHLIVAQ